METYVAEASSHEFGHNLGLSHDGTNSGATYYGGHGSGLVSWAPIMGNSYNNNVTQWSKGEYPDANQSRDDLAIIEGKLGYKPDDHGDTPAGATALAGDVNGAVVASNQELDPYDTLPENTGIVGSESDIDVFSFVAGAGTVNLTINPSWDAFYRSSSRRGANLDIEAELRNQAGATIAYDDPVNDTRAVITASVGAGTYYLLISGVGNAVTPYSEYDSLGQYFINGSIPVATPDNASPVPNPMTWSAAPAALSDTAISMTATTAVDDISAVEYRFLCVTGDVQCNNANSGWQSRRSYTNTFSDDGSSQGIGEVESGGKPASRYSYLEHRWNFNVSSGTTVTLYVNAWSSGSGDGDSFRFEYSVNNGASFSSLLTVSSVLSSNLQMANIPGAPSGAIIIRVVDTGLAAQTTYYYRVSAYTQPQLISPYASASGTTQAAPQLGLTAQGYKVKAQNHVDLRWDGSNNVDIYRNDVRIATVNGGNSYDDSIGKSGGTFKHKACDTVSGACSNVTTTVF